MLTITAGDVTEVGELEVEGSQFGEDAVRSRPVVLPARLPTHTLFNFCGMKIERVGKRCVRKRA